LFYNKSKTKQSALGDIMKKQIFALTLLLLSQNLFANTWSHAHSHGWWMLLMYVGWWIIASILLFFTWNKVISFISSWKEVKFWQVLLFVATVSFFCSSKKHMGCHKKSCYKTCHKGIQAPAQQAPSE
jgi:hypothetical protein